jgi:hypothetical protein
LKRILTFSAFATADQVYQEATVALRGMPGVRSVEVLVAASGKPEFCLILDTDDARDAEIGANLDAGLAEYAAYLTQVSHRAYRRVG